MVWLPAHSIKPGQILRYHCSAQGRPEYRRNPFFIIGVFCTKAKEILQNQFFWSPVNRQDPCFGPADFIERDEQGGYIPDIVSV